MSNKAKFIFLFLAGLILLLILIQQSGDYKITGIIDGNTIVLESGTTVKLIGVTSTNEGKAYLEQEFLNMPVNLKSDQSAPFDASMIGADDVVYAYVLAGENANIHINGLLLRKGKADILTGTFLHDSLEVFNQYAKMGMANRKKGLTPTLVPQIRYRDDDIILPSPPRDKKLQRKHSAWYSNGDKNLEMIEEACDYMCPYTKQFANCLASRSPGKFNPGQICEIFDYCNSKWSYVNDPKGHEYVAAASETIEGNLSGDCDDFAILMASCILAVGGEVCLNTGHNPSGGHAFTEVDIAPFGENAVLSVVRDRFRVYGISGLHTRKDGVHLWLNLDWQASYPGGPYYDCSSKRDAYPCVNGIWKWKKLN